jgi:hypothetical protein
VKMAGVIKVFVRVADTTVRMIYCAHAQL